MCREGQSCRSKRVLTYEKRLVSENLEPDMIFFEEIQVCPIAAVGTGVLEDCRIRQAERAGVRMEARQGQDNGEYRRAWFTTAGPLGHGINQTWALPNHHF